MEYLQKMGIQIGFLISGLFGAILMATKNDKTDVKSVFLSLIGGISAANFLTPVLVDTLNVTNVKHQNGIAFIAGFLGELILRSKQSTPNYRIKESLNLE